jgi:L-alanine-DL-glutamate epimerase-like enolase superfamily enzyme
VRAFYKTWYRDIVTAVPPVANGRITVSEGAGLGLELAPDLDRQFTISRQLSGKASS